MKRLLLFVFSILAVSCTDGKPTEDLKTRIETKLKDAVTQFEPTNNMFLFTVYSNDTAIVQVVHRSYIELTRQPDDNFGLVVNVTFDPTFAEEVDNHKKFKNLAISKEFVSYTYGGIPCYALDIDKNADKGAEVLTILLIELYGFDNDTNFETDLLDLGRLK